MACPGVRAGVGAVATQASTRTEYGQELLDFMEGGLSPQEAMDRAIASDPDSPRRQVGVVGMDGTSAQHTGTLPGAWAGHRSGPNYATQGNVLVGPEVIAAVAATFEASEGSGRHLADRLIEALAAGQSLGGDRREGRFQSAAVIVADPREGRSRRPDGYTANINVCQHDTPVAELRRHLFNDFRYARLPRVVAAVGHRRVASEAHHARARVLHGQLRSHHARRRLAVL